MSKAILNINGVIGEDVTLVDVMSQFNSYEDVESVHVYVNSVGGYVDEGKAIFNYLKGLDSKTPVTTETGMAYSIAAQIFTAGSTRIVEDKEDVFMIHCPWVDGVTGDSKELEAVASGLKAIETEFVNYYSKLIDTDKNTIQALLDADTFMNGQEAVNLGFATEVKTSLQAVAMYKASENLKTKKQMAKKDEKSFIAKLFNFLKEHVDEGKARSQVELQDSNGETITFPDVEEGTTPAVGDEGTIDGSPVPDGTYVMPGLGNAVVTFEGGEITLIEEGATEEEETTEEEEQATAPQINARLKVLSLEDAKAEQLLQISVWPIESASTSFSVGDKVTYKDWDENEVPVSAGEYQRADGTRIVTDASGTIVDVKGADENSTPTIDAEAKQIEALNKMVQNQAKMVEAQAKEIKELKKLVGSPSINAMGDKQPKAKIQEPIGVARYFK